MYIKSLRFSGPDPSRKHMNSLRSSRFQGSSSNRVRGRLLQVKGLEVAQSSMLGAFLLDLGLNWVGWAASALLKTEKFYDLTGSLSFISTSLYSLLSAPPSASGLRGTVATAMVCTWAGRLGTFLFRRVLRHGTDSRFDDVREKPGWLFVYWTLQSVWVFLTSFPVFHLHANGPGPAVTNPSGLNPTDVIGVALWLAGFLIEAVADAQKTKWKRDPKTKDKFIDTGLWGLARYPNYGGEIMLWTGVWVFAGMNPWTALGPVWVAFQLLKMSGVPIQERQAQERWGKTKEYQEYRDRTNLLLPLPRLGGVKKAP